MPWGRAGPHLPWGQAFAVGGEEGGGEGGYGHEEEGGGAKPHPLLERAKDGAPTGHTSPTATLMPLC